MKAITRRKHLTAAHQKVLDYSESRNDKEEEQQILQAMKALAIQENAQPTRGP